MWWVLTPQSHYEDLGILLGLQLSTWKFTWECEGSFPHTLCTPMSMWSDSLVSLLARNLATPCFGCEPKARVATKTIKKINLFLTFKIGFQNLNAKTKKIIFNPSSFFLLWGWSLIMGMRKFVFFFSQFSFPNKFISKSLDSQIFSFV